MGASAFVGIYLFNKVVVAITEPAVYLMAAELFPSHGVSIFRIPCHHQHLGAFIGTWPKLICSPSWIRAGSPNDQGELVTPPW